MEITLLEVLLPAPRAGPRLAGGAWARKLYLRDSPTNSKERWGVGREASDKQFLLQTRGEPLTWNQVR